ncbi:MAG: hypothetical protein JWN70_5279 [Planctomycetaceae bacterium]|nr:hypothetical protein [Planctomycetaceae bacterium]
MRLFRNWATISCLTACCAVAGCQGGNDGFKTAEEVKKERPDAGKKEHDHDHDHDHGHHHHAPHHGSLTMLGEHVAQIELVVDAEAGKVEAYILDGEAEKPLVVDQTDLELAITLPEATEPLTLKLTPADAAKQDDGFVAQDDKLKGVKAFKGTLTSLKIKDKAHEKVAVEFDAKKAAAEAEEAHHEGHAHDEKKGDAHKDHDHEDEKKTDAKKPEDKPADEKPADEKPAEEKPAAENK